MAVFYACNYIYVLPCDRLSAPIVFQPSPDAPTLYYDDILQLVGKQWWPIHYSINHDFQHISSRRCHIRHDDLSVASPRLAFVDAFPNSHFLVSSFHIDCAGHHLQLTSTGKSQTYHPLSLHPTMRSEYLRVFFSCVSSKFYSYDTVNSIATSVVDCLETSTASGLSFFP